MNHRIVIFLGALVFAAAIAAPVQAPVQAQDAQPSQPATPTTQPAVPASAPQSAVQDSSAGNASAAPAPAQPAKTPAKRVWTDDDMNDLRSSSSISTVGNAKSGSATPGAKLGATPRNKNAQYYHDQITRLQAQIPPIDKKMSALQDALEGKPVTEARQYGGVKPGDWKDALAQLQKQRDDISAKIQALEDQARRSGIPDNQIP